MTKSTPSTNCKTKLHRMTLHNNFQAISVQEIRRAARCGGMKPISGLVYNGIQGIFHKYIEKIIPDAVLYLENAQHKMITVMDVVHALKGNVVFIVILPIPFLRSLKQYHLYSIF